MVDEQGYCALTDLQIGDCFKWGGEVHLVLDRTKGELRFSLVDTLRRHRDVTYPSNIHVRPVKVWEFVDGERKHLTN